MKNTNVNNWNTEDLYTFDASITTDQAWDKSSQRNVTGVIHGLKIITAGLSVHHIQSVNVVLDDLTWELYIWICILNEVGI